MNLASKQHPIEMVVEWLAPLPLALAVAWAGRSVGISLAGAAGCALAAFALGFVAVRRIGGAGNARPFDFEPTTLERDAFEPDELLLEAKDEVLLLDDPLTDVAQDSRVVRLFARQEPTPGELVERIADFLGEERRPPPVHAQADFAQPADASAALHAALANIRASLR